MFANKQDRREGKAVLNGNVRVKVKYEEMVNVGSRHIIMQELEKIYLQTYPKYNDSQWDQNSTLVQQLWAQIGLLPPQDPVVDPIMMS